MYLDQATIDEFFSTIENLYPGFDKGAEGIRIVLSYNQGMTGTDFINLEMRKFFKDPDSSLFNKKTESEIKEIVSSKSINSRINLNHLYKIRRFWNIYRKSKNINAVFGFQQGRLQVR